MTNVAPIPQTSPTISVPTTIDYTSRDYSGFVQSMLIFASQVFPNWQPQSTGDIGVMLLELFAYVGDILSYYTDRVAQEAYLPTATQRQSLLNIAQLLGYVPSNGTPSSGTVTFQSANPGLAVVIPSGTSLQSNFNTALDQPILFYTTAVATCPGNGGTVTVNVNQGQQFSLVALGTSTGLPGQIFQIPQAEVQDGTVTVFVQSSAPGGTTQWQPVTSFINASSSATAFTFFVDANGITNLTFGDGINGLIPGLGLTVYASYTVIVGASGNLPIGAVNIIVSPIASLSIAQNAAGVAQSSIMAGGSDPESNASIRANAPISFATQQRAVSLSDFANLAVGIPGVITAKAVANHSTSVSLYIIGPNITVPSPQLKTQILNFFANATLAGVTLSLPQPNLIPVDVGSTTSPVTIQVLPTYSQLQVQNAVILALNNLLTPPATQFGMLLNVSVIYQAIMAVAGVSYAIVPVFTREDIVQTGTTNIQFRNSEIPIAGNFFLTMQGGM